MDETTATGLKALLSLVVRATQPVGDGGPTGAKLFDYTAAWSGWIRSHIRTTLPPWPWDGPTTAGKVQEWLAEIRVKADRIPVILPRCVSLITSAYDIVRMTATLHPASAPDSGIPEPPPSGESE